MKTMHLVVATNMVGSECSVDLGVTPDEWEGLSEEDQSQLISEFRANVMEEHVVERGCE